MKVTFVDAPRHSRRGKGDENRSLLQQKRRIWKGCSAGRVVKWERILPQRHLRVLVVESDDSTRLILSAVLTNCCYQVTAAGDGKQAWELLQDPSNDFDLVLTEVDIPSISGIELLHRIRRYSSCKKVPVVMMSSHHSMKYVLQSLSEGAVDFLIKPLRKNELQNIWQHVWRRLRRSTYNGSGSKRKSDIHLRKSMHGNGETIKKGYLPRANNVIEIDCDEDVPKASPHNVCNGIPGSLGANNIAAKEHDYSLFDLNRSENVCSTGRKDKESPFSVSFNISKAGSNEPNSKIAIQLDKKSVLQDGKNQGSIVRKEANALKSKKFEAIQVGSEEDEDDNFGNRRFLQQNRPSAFSWYNSCNENEMVEHVKDNAKPDGSSDSSMNKNGPVQASGSESPSAMKPPELRSLSKETGTNPPKDCSLNNNHPASKFTPSSKEANPCDMGIPNDRVTAAFPVSFHFGLPTNMHPNLIAFDSINHSLASGVHPTFAGLPNWTFFMPQSLGRTVENAHPEQGIIPPQFFCHMQHTSHPNIYPPQNNQHNCYFLNLHNHQSKQDTSNGLAMNSLTCPSNAFGNFPNDSNVQNMKEYEKVPAPKEGTCPNTHNAGSGDNQSTNTGVSLVFNSEHARVKAGVASGSGITEEARYIACNPRLASLDKFRQKRNVRCFGKKVRYVKRKALAEQRPRIKGQFVKQAAPDLTMGGQNG